MKIRGIGPGSVFAVTFLVYLVVPAIWSAIDGTLRTHAANGKVVEGFIQPINANIFVLPFLFAFIVNYYQNSIGIIDRLVARGVLEDTGRIEGVGGTLFAGGSRPDVASFIARTRWSRIAAVALFVLLVVMMAVPIKSGFSRDTNNWLFDGSRTRWLGVYFFTMFNGLGVYFIVGWALNHYRLARGLRRVFRIENREAIHLATLHPDGCMGLGPVSDVAKSAALVLLAVSFWIFVWQIGAFVGLQGRSDGFVHEMFRVFDVGIVAHLREGGRGLIWLASWIVYLFVAPTVFFAPLSVLREFMREQKESDLAELSKQLFDTTDNLILVANKGLYRALEKTRVWPFNVETMISFLASFLSPLILTVAAEYILSHIVG